MSSQFLLLALVCLSLAINVSGFLNCHCCVCLFCCKRRVISPVRVLTGKTEVSRSLSLPERFLKSEENVPINGNILEPGVFLALCDVDENDALSFEEYDGCLQQIGSHQEESFESLDSNDDGELSLSELRSLAVTVEGTGDCYQDLTTGCAAQFVMYEKIRGVERKSFCGGLQYYHNCIAKSAVDCEDPRTDKIKGVFAWTQKQLKGTCNPEDSIAPLGPIQRATLRCSSGLIRALHGSRPPCVAMAIYTKCMTKAGAKDREMLFDDVTQLVGCDQE